MQRRAGCALVKQGVTLVAVIRYGGNRVPDAEESREAHHDAARRGFISTRSDRDL